MGKRKRVKGLDSSISGKGAGSILPDETESATILGQSKKSKVESGSTPDRTPSGSPTRTSTGGIVTRSGGLVTDTEVPEIEQAREDEEGQKGAEKLELEVAEVLRGLSKRDDQPGIAVVPPADLEALKLKVFGSKEAVSTPVAPSLCQLYLLGLSSGS